MYRFHRSTRTATPASVAGTLASRYGARLVAGLGVLCVIGAWSSSDALAATSADADVVQSVWKPVEIRYSYMGFTTAYNCDAAEDKLKQILMRVGAHPQTRVVASGCTMNRPERNFFITITTATPVAADSAAAEEARGSAAGDNGRGRSLSKSEQELLDKLGVKQTISTDEFPATWKTVDLSRDRKLDLRPGDCELMAGLRDHVFPKLPVEILSDRIQCTPKQLDLTTPELKVKALVKLPSADEPLRGTGT